MGNFKVFSFFSPWPTESSSAPPEISFALSFSLLHDFHWLKGCVDKHLILPSNDNHFTHYMVLKGGLISSKAWICVNHDSCIVPVTHRVPEQECPRYLQSPCPSSFCSWIIHKTAVKTTGIKWWCHKIMVFGCISTDYVFVKKYHQNKAACALIWWRHTTPLYGHHNSAPNIILLIFDIFAGRFGAVFADAFCLGIYTRQNSIFFPSS